MPLIHFSEIETHQKGRLAVLSEQCQELGLTGGKIEDFPQKTVDAIDFVVDDIHKVMMKPIQKTGCTSWRMLMIKNAYKNNITNLHIGSFAKKHYHHIGLGITKDYPFEEALQRLRDYFCILTVRHPLRRLESYFMNNFLVRNMRFSRHEFVPKAKMSRLFEQFIEVFFTEGSKNSHWRTIFEQSYPCTIHYRCVKSLMQN